MSTPVTFAGHLWTLVPNLRHRARPWRPPPGEAWSTTVQDAKIGAVTLRGALHRAGPDGTDGTDRTASRELVLLVHGLGGSIDSHYVVQAARAAAAAGIDSLRLALRGADRQGEDFYHAGLTVDLEAALASPALAAYEHLYVLGFSLGGHVTLCHALRPSDARLRAVASVCAPLDLAAGCSAIDHPRAAVYCGHVLAGLKEIYTAVARRREVPTPLASVRRLTTIRGWDRLAVVPRFGFVSVGDYHGSCSVGPRLGQVQVPALVLSATADPMIPAATVAPHVRELPTIVTHRWVARGGHVGFPAQLRLDLGLEQAPPGLAPQVLAWLRRHGASGLP